MANSSRIIKMIHKKCDINDWELFASHPKIRLTLDRKSVVVSEKKLELLQPNGSIATKRFVFVFFFRIATCPWNFYFFISTNQYKSVAHKFLFRCQYKIFIPKAVFFFSNKTKWTNFNYVLQLFRLIAIVVLWSAKYLEVWCYAVSITTY